MKPTERHELHVRLADAMEAYADAASTVGVPIGDLFDKEMKQQRFRARRARKTPR